jgi:hypothetical protein
MYRKDMHDWVKYSLGLQEITDYDEGGMIDNLLHQGAIDLLARTKCVARCLHLRVKAGVDEYTLDHSVLSLIDVDDGKLPKARRDQTSYSPAFTLVRADVLRLEPPPDEDGTVDSWAVMRPEQMTDDGDSPGFEDFGAIPDEYQDAILLYALWKGAEYSNDQPSVVGERYRVLYEGQDGQGGRLAQIRSSVNKRASARGPARRVLLPTQPDKSIWVG